MEHVSLFDIISIALILILGIKGILNGFIKEVFGLVGIIGGIYFASHYSFEAGELIDAYIFKFNNKTMLELIGFIGVLVIFWISSIFIGHLMAQAFRMSGLGAIDKIAGFTVGSLKIFLVFAAFVALLNQIEFLKKPLEPYIKNSKMLPVFTEAGRRIVKLDHKQLVKDVKPLLEKVNP